MKQQCPGGEHGLFRSRLMGLCWCVLGEYAGQTTKIRDRSVAWSAGDMLKGKRKKRGAIRSGQGKRGSSHQRLNFGLSEGMAVVPEIQEPGKEVQLSPGKGYLIGK